MSTCRRCRTSVPDGHGYCSPCAVYTDGYDCGATYCDDFEGTTEAAAVAFEAEAGDGAWEQYATEGECYTEGDARAVFRAGMLNGLKSAAVANAKRAAERPCPHCEEIHAGNTCCP